MASNRPIFVVGCPRSGTTMFTLMLHAHSRIAMAPETKFVLEVFRRRREFGDLRVLENREAVALAVARGQGTKLRDLRLDRAAVQQSIAEGPPTVGSAIGAVFSAYAARFDKQRWGDKRPSYIRNLATILALFPDAQVIHLIRDARDCVASLKGMPWAAGNALSFLATWTLAIDTGRRAVRRLPPGTFHEVQYERLVAQPRAELEAVCEFLAEDFQEGMLEPHLMADQVVPARTRDTWHSHTWSAVSAGQIGASKTSLEPWELALVEYVAASRLRRLGYQVPDSPLRPPARVLARYAAGSASLRTRTRLAGLQDRRTARWDGPVADLTRS